MKPSNGNGEGKKFTVVFTEMEDGVVVHTHNQGFNPMEVVGTLFLEMVRTVQMGIREESENDPGPQG